MYLCINEDFYIKIVGEYTINKVLKTLIIVYDELVYSLHVKVDT